MTQMVNLHAAAAIRRERRKAIFNVVLDGVVAVLFVLVVGYVTWTIGQANALAVCMGG